MNSLVISILPFGLIILLLGFVLKKFPPPMNIAFGYRSPFAKQNSDTWAVANSYAANLLMIEGGILTGVGLISFGLPDIGAIGTIIGSVLLLVFAIILVAFTERHLHQIFDKNGNRRKI
ncbi:MAG TPA: SdpI family protein [Chitinophagales bacterium]|nr:SdpI family protein [Chitinophagales bacterium]